MRSLRATAAVAAVALLAIPLPSAYALRSLTTENPATLAGLEEGLGRHPVSRRAFLQSAGWAAAAALFGISASAQSPIRERPPLPRGALLPLRGALGIDRTIGLIINDPTELTRVSAAEARQFFALAVAAGVDTAWISGFRFDGLPSASRQTILTAASEAGLPTLGFVDGAPDWPESRPFVRALYQRLTTKLRSHRLGQLRILFATNVERYALPGWNGDLAPVMDLHEQDILPAIQGFADTVTHPNGGSVVAGPPVVLEAWWLENGRRTASGVVVRGRRPLSGAIAGMTYRDTVKDLLDVGEAVWRRAQADQVMFLMGVDTLPESEAGTPTYAGQTAQIGRDLTAVARLLPGEVSSRFGGVFIHARNPAEALTLITTWLAAPPVAPRLPVFQSPVRPPSQPSRAPAPGTRTIPSRPVRGGLEEQTDEFLGERLLEKRAVGELA